MKFKVIRADKPHLEANRPQLGQRVRVRAVAHPTDGRVRKWIAYTCDPFEGVFVGVRFKRNGYTSGGPTWDYDDEAPYFVVKETVEVWLVADNPYHNPKCVLPEDCVVVLDRADQWSVLRSMVMQAMRTQITNLRIMI